MPSRLLLACSLALLPSTTWAGSLRVDPPSLTLRGSQARYSLLVETPSPLGPLDRTHQAVYRSANPAIARVSPTGVVSGVKDGSTIIRITADGQQVEVPITVTGSTSPRTFHFENDIIPILSRGGCNSSGCHGKAEGQNGFKLSVFGFDPAADLVALVKEGRGRRILPSAPERSLLLRKMSGEMAHGGGARVRVGTPAYETVRGWIAAGTPRGAADAPRVETVRVEPRERILPFRGQQQLRVVARYSDGSERDVTDQARFQVNNDALARVDEDGLVSVGDIPGQAAVLASFLNVMDTFQLLVPRPERIDPYPKLPEHNFIDTLVHARLRKLQILPSDLCDDATFLRRACLDITGTLPTPDEARQFLADRHSDKRARLVDRLLERPEFADYQAMLWADLLRVERTALGNRQARAYHRWIRQSIADGVPFDRLARSIVTAEGPLSENPQAGFYKAVANKPGEAANSLAQVFLGVRIACAECHHHPFDRWSQTDYYGMTAFFSGLRIQKAGKEEELTVTGLASARHSRTGETILAHGLGEKSPEKREPGDVREELAEWMTSPSNPWFSRNLANRVWSRFLGRGLVEPVDDVRATNPPSNPELLDALAKHVVETKYDLRALIRTITASRTYQLSTTPNATNERDGQNYSRRLLERVPAEVLCDMVSQVTGVPERFRGEAPGTRAIQLWDNKVPHYFLKVFGRPERTGSCACERVSEPSVAQVLHLFNAGEIQDRLSHADGTVARLVKKYPEDGPLVEELYLTFFARLPDEKERAAVLAHLKKNQAQRQQAAEDLAWSLLNTLEFAFNH
jgi:hypothetical protein